MSETSMNSISNIAEMAVLGKDAPEKLYYKGDLGLLSARKISIVGSRKMSVYTKNLVFSLASALKNAGFVVVSGGALGTDITAHSGAFPRTIGVFANGLNHIYPPSNARTIAQIYEHALALSEYEPGETAKNYNFVRRNRIVVALGEALVIAQADTKSGSMRSAEFALKMGKPIYVLPQRMGESDGTNGLLARGQARLISSVADFLAILGAGQSAPSRDDKIIEWISKNDNFDEAFGKFGDALYEYELDGKIEIVGNRIIVL